MEYQNITLSLPKDTTLRRVKHVAIEQNTSVSAVLAKVLEDLLQKEEAYQKARTRHLAVLEESLDLGTQGVISWERMDIHER
ncbi:MAG: CopG family transcriptional regulator [Bacillota bacterium]